MAMSLKGKNNQAIDIEMKDGGSWRIRFQEPDFAIALAKALQQNGVETGAGLAKIAEDEQEEDRQISN
jgi:hypothetical protein